MFLRLFIFSVWAFLGTPASAQEPFNYPITEKLGQDRHWLYAYSANFGFEEGLPACVAFGGYRSGTYLILAREIDGGWLMAALNPSWEFITQGNNYDIAFQFDLRGRSTGSGLGFSSDLGNGFVIGVDLTFVEWLAGARGMDLQFEGRQIDSFDLSGSRAAVEAVRSCFDIRLNQPAQLAVNPAPPVYGGSETNILPGWTADEAIPGTGWKYSERHERGIVMQCQIDLDVSNDGYKLAAAVLGSGAIAVAIVDSNWKQRISIDHGWQTGRELEATLWTDSEKGMVNIKVIDSLAHIVDSQQFLVFIPKEDRIAIDSFFNSDRFGLVIGGKTAKWWLSPKLPEAWKRLQRCSLNDSSGSAVNANSDADVLQKDIGELEKAIMELEGKSQ